MKAFKKDWIAFHEFVKKHNLDYANARKKLLKFDDKYKAYIEMGSRCHWFIYEPKAKEYWNVKE